MTRGKGSIANMAKLCLNFSMKRLGLLLLMLVSSCGGNTGELLDVIEGNQDSRAPIELCSSYRIKEYPTAAGYAAQQVAANAWNEAAGFPLITFVKETGNVDLEISGDLGVNSEGRRIEGGGGFTGYCEGRIIIDSSFAEKEDLWAHEIGHVLGFNHTEDENSIMHPGGNDRALTTGIIDLLRQALAAN